MLDRMDEEQIALHVRIVGWVHILGEAIGVVVALGFFMLMNGIAFASGDPDAERILPLLAALGCGFFVILSLPGLIAGVGLLQRRAWARVLALVVGFFDLFFIPIGTAIGAYTFYVLLQDAARSYFEEDGSGG